jgi:hypothetical protein
MIRNEEGKEKQDCGRKAAKRRPKNNGQRYGRLKLTLLGDDLYSDYNTRKAVKDGNFTYITGEAVPKLQFWNSNLKIRSFARLKA